MLIKNNILSLPLLDKRIKKIITLKINKEYDTKKLLEIINADSSLRVRLLFLANKSFFSFPNYIQSSSKALSLYGMNFTSSICIIELILNTIKFDLRAYSFSYEKYLYLFDFTYKIINEFIDEKDIDLKEKLLIPMFLYDIGKFIFSKIVYEQKEEKVFKDKFIECKNVLNFEKSYFSYSSYEVSAYILKYWNFDKEIEDIIYYVSNPSLAKDNKKLIYLLDIIQSLTNLSMPYSHHSINEALIKTRLYGFDWKKLEKIIKSNKNNIRILHGKS